MAIALRFLLIYNKSNDYHDDSDRKPSSNSKLTESILLSLEEQVAVNKHRFSLQTWSILLEAFAESSDL